MGHLLSDRRNAAANRYAVERASAWGSPVLYAPPVSRPMMRCGSVRRHQAERPSTWTTFSLDRTSCQSFRSKAPAPMAFCSIASPSYVEPADVRAVRRSDATVDELCAALRKVGRPAAIVTSEVGWGLFRDPLGRLFRDAAGRANQVAARHAQKWC
jgi:adenosyl cobinamide kinase/adenosyl cobinamide phosphate guanylyltransferase